mmetsp:Transcript_9306/g.25620  ORF Transcript_9306/g.25620 Transcript_9306/m.25620 type:complete len:274 (-) Transcript_9306:22-843(-)
MQQPEVPQYRGCTAEVLLQGGHRHHHRRKRRVRRGRLRGNEEVRVDLRFGVGNVRRQGPGCARGGRRPRELGRLQGLPRRELPRGLQRAHQAAALRGRCCRHCSRHRSEVAGLARRRRRGLGRRRRRAHAGGAPRRRADRPRDDPRAAPVQLEDGDRVVRVAARRQARSVALAGGRHGPGRNRAVGVPADARQRLPREFEARRSQGRRRHREAQDEGLRAAHRHLPLRGRAVRLAAATRQASHGLSERRFASATQRAGACELPSEPLAHASLA